MAGLVAVAAGKGASNISPQPNGTNPTVIAGATIVCPNDVLAAESRKAKGRIPRNSGNCQREVLYVKLATANGATIVTKKRVSSASLLPCGHCLRILLTYVVFTALVVAAARSDYGLVATEGAENKSHMQNSAWLVQVMVKK